MKYQNDQDRPLQFHNNSEVQPAPARIRNAYVVDGLVREAEADTPMVYDNVTAYAAATRKAKDRFGGEFGNGGGMKAGKYNSAVRKQLHCQQEYCPCSELTPEEYAERKAIECE